MYTITMNMPKQKAEIAEDLIRYYIHGIAVKDRGRNKSFDGGGGGKYASSLE